MVDKNLTEGKSCNGYKGNPCVVGSVQPLSCFYLDSRMKSGYRNVCKSCEKRIQADRYRDNRDEILCRTKAYGKANRDVTRKASKTYYHNNREASIQRKLKWNRDNPEKANHAAAMYRAKTKQATPEWLSKDQKDQILSVYKHAKECEILTGDKYHVDHIVPLRGENISGLHVPWNLQILPADVNISKGNKYYG